MKGLFEIQTLNVNFMKAVWDISNKCNLKCKYCGSNFQKNYNRTFCDIEKIVSNIKGIVDEVELFGGEPLILENIENILEKLSLNGIGINITTNGQNGNAILHFILDNNIKINNLFVSIDGNEDENDFLRGKGSYKKAMSFLHESMHLKHMYQKNWNVGISAVITSYNKSNVIENITNWLGLGVDYIIVTPVANIGRVKENAQLLLDANTTLDIYEDIAEYIVKNSLQDKIILDVTTPLLAEYLNTTFGTRYQIGRNSCTAVERTIFINSEGKLKACRYSEEYIANLSKESLKDSYCNFTKFMKQKKEFSVEMKCNCIYNRICNKCCLSTDDKKEEICLQIEKKYHISNIEESRYFVLSEQCCLYDNAEQDYYNIYFPTLQENVSYDPEGYKILKLIYKKKRKSVEIAQKLEMDRELVFRFLMQEYSKCHVEMEG